jgi:glycosyltransferase involved in cell wall biosynthesis
MSCLESALAQTLTSFEVIVAYTGSADATGELARSLADPRVRVVEQPKRGIAAARNSGIAVARGEIICFLDSDDLLLPSYLAAVAGAFARRPEAAWVYTDAWALDDRTRRIRKRTAMAYGNGRPPAPDPATAEAMFRKLLEANFVFNSAAVRASALAAVGSFDESVVAAEDWELWLRLAANGFVAARAPGQHAIYRLHQNQASRNEAQTARYIVSILEKVLDSYPLSPTDRPLVEQALTRSRRSLALVEKAHPWLVVVHRLQHSLMRVRSSIDWYRHPPAAVAEAFADLDRL